MGELEPCPFCRCEVKTAVITFDEKFYEPPYEAWYLEHADIVAASEEHCPIPTTDTFYDTEAEAIEAWNTRADDYRHAAEYWQRMYENTFTERTCRMTDRGECSECGAYIVRAWTEVHDFNGDMKRIDLRSHNYCPNCGAKVIGGKDGVD